MIGVSYRGVKTVGASVTAGNSVYPFPDEVVILSYTGHRVLHCRIGLDGTKDAGLKLVPFDEDSQVPAIDFAPPECVSFSDFRQLFANSISRDTTLVGRQLDLFLASLGFTLGRTQIRDLGESQVVRSLVGERAPQDEFVSAEILKRPGHDMVMPDVHKVVFGVDTGCARG